MIGTPCKTCIRSSSSTRGEVDRERVQRCDPVRSRKGGRTEEGEKADLFVTLKQNDSSSLVSGRKIVTRRVEFNGRDNIGYTQHLRSERRSKGR